VSKSDFTPELKEAVKEFWRARKGKVTAGKHLDGFIKLFRKLVVDAGLPSPDVALKKQLVTLPGYFRATKKWDLVVYVEGRLLAVIELKSQVGSFTKNANNRAEEALGNAVDFETARKAGAYGSGRRPFLGYVILVQDCEFVHNPPKRQVKPSYFEIFPEFSGATFAERYKILCEKLVRMGHYDAAAVMLSPSSGIKDGRFKGMSELTDIRRLIRELRARILAQAGRRKIEVDINPAEPFSH
jgi:hypothetical protein